MKKKIKIIISCIIAASVILTGVVIAFADQENQLEIPHSHEYQITDFNNGTATISCVICNDSYTDYFTNHINEQGYCVFDMNNDNFVNVRDYSILIQMY